jgi:carboxyl-terminal processing protease
MSQSRLSILRPAGVLVLALALTAGSLASARPTNPTARDRQIAIAVATLMEKVHLSRHAVDDEMSARCLDSLLKTLDPLKLFFMQSDLDEFAAHKNNLDDMLKRGDITAAHLVFNRFLQRVDERIAVALQQVDAPHDFTIDEEMVRDRKVATYATTVAEANEKWRKRVKYDLLREIVDEVEEQEAKDKLRRRYTSIRKRWEQTSNDELLEIYLSAMTSSFDPHSTYMSPSTLENFKISMELKLDGIGASLRSEDGYTTVHEIIAGGAADQDGRLKEKDQILGVGQGPDGKIEDIVDMNLNDVVKKIRGERGTVVRLEVKPAANPTTRQVYAITRQEIKLTESEARSQIVEWGTKPNGQPYKVGVISLPSFYMDMDARGSGDPNYKSATRDVRRLIQGFNEQQVDAVMFDLRFNGGGSLSEAVELTGLFIDKGPVVQVKGPDGKTEPLADPNPGIVWSGPMVVLTNRFSASASEIFAGAIQDYGRGIVIGDESTHGKGTVQQLYDLARVIFRIEGQNLGALKLTIQQFYRPDGDSTQNLGVVSDVAIPSITNHLDEGESGLDFAMAFDRVSKLHHDRYNMVTPNMVKELWSRSTERIKASEEFRRDLDRIAAFKEQNESKTVTLNKEKFIAEREKLDAEKETEDTLERATDSDKPVFATDNHYNREALAILADYLELLKDNRVAIGR